MGTPAEELEAKLAQFEERYPTEGTQLRAMVTGSPELSALLKESIGKGNLDGGFRALSDPMRRLGILGTFNADSETLFLPMDLLKSNKSQDGNTLLSTLGHETAHAINKEAIEQRYTKLDNDVSSASKGTHPRDYTAAIKEFLETSRRREASDEIGGVNVLAAKIKRENPEATQDQLFQALHDSTQDVRDYIDATGPEGALTFAPKPGITFTSEFQIPLNKDNVEAFGQHFYDHRGYADNYGMRVINGIAAVEAKAQAAERAIDPSRPSVPAKVDLQALGLDPNTTLPGNMVNGSSPRLEAPEASPEAASTQRASIPTTEREPHAGTTPNTTQQGTSPRSATSEQLLQDSERLVRQTADKHHLPWDKGMDNTVHAMAQGAREAGLTGITHFKAENGTLHMAQYDGHTIKELQLNAHTAANTPAEQSREQLQQQDQATPPPSIAAPARTLEPEMALSR